MLVVVELLFVHFCQAALLRLLLHLAAKEVLVLPIDRLNLGVEALLFELVVILVSLPDHGLLIVLSLLHLLTVLLLLHLAAKEQAHLLLLFTHELGPSFVFKTRAHLLLVLVVEESLLLVADSVLLLADDLTGEIVHEVLGAGLTGFEFVEAVELLLIKHLAIFDLSHNIGADLGLAICISLLLVRLVFTEHLLQVLLLLAPLLLLQGTLHLHLILKAIDEVNLLLEGIFVVVLLAPLFVTKLAIATFLLLLDLFSLCAHLLLLTLT